MNTKAQAQEIILQLVENFADQIDYYKKNKDYNETKTRKDYVDPFFEALGWDLANKSSEREFYRDVILEDKIKIEGKMKAPDYCFTIKGNKKFFLEAKKPSVMIERDTAPAYQIRRYGWSASLPISLLTDFEEFAIYDCSLKPELTDKASIGRLKYIRFTDYEKEFDTIWDLFSKEQVLKGSLEQFAKTEKKGNSGVDAEFLRSLDLWRDRLARDFVRQNPEIDEDSLNFVLQKTLDRIIFLRICEDRGIEHYGRLQQVLKGNFYQNLFQYFKEADQKYNSGLFAFEKDKISGGLKLDNGVLRSIVDELYYPTSPYEFSVIPVEILGNAYEQFLGKTIRLNPTPALPKGEGEMNPSPLGKGRVAVRIEIEEKPEVRKAGGVYYTPQYIVEYIVRNTIGTKIAEIEKRNIISSRNDISEKREGLIEAISKLKICDPACGSGSFLLGAYQFLLDWHLDFYLKNPAPALPKGEGVRKETSDASVRLNSPTKSDRRSDVKAKVGVQVSPLTPDGKLTSQEKRRILLNNIYGVDIDSNAVEVTKLSLLLKAMEGETTASIKQSLQIFHERVLPTLDNNIKEGNSLIDWDFYENQIDFEPAVGKKIKPFNWEQQFPEVFKRKNPQGLQDLAGLGGFDIILGNPPYVKEYTSKETFDHIKKSHISQYYQGKMDLWYFFVCQALDLLKTEGIFGFIVPNNWVTNSGASILRNKIVEDSKIIEMIDFGSFMVFKDASIQTMILIAERNKHEDLYSFLNIKAFEKNTRISEIQNMLQGLISENAKILNPIFERKKYKDQFLTFENADNETLLSKIKEKGNFVLDEKKEVAQGIVPNPDVVSKNALDKIPTFKVNKHNIKVGDGVFVVNFSFGNNLNNKELSFLKPLYEPYHLSKYFVPKDSDKRIIYITKKNFSNGIDNLINHLDKFREIMNDRRENQNGLLDFYHLHWSRDEKFFKEGAKILCVRKCIKPTFSYTELPSYVMMSINVIRELNALIKNI